MKKAMKWIVVGLMVCAVQAKAAAMLELWDGVNAPVTVTDQMPGSDFNSAVGAVTWIGAVGNWFLSVSTGQS